MEHIRIRLALLALLCCQHAAAGEWTAITWRELPALACSQAGWTATVVPAWGRLVGLRSPDGTDILRVPAKTLEESRGGPAGGHMVWLCPQERWKWPPPAHWEYAAGVATSSGATLTLALPAGDPGMPTLTRTYQWTADGLRCGVSWHSSERWYALHVFQVRGDADVRIPAGGPAPLLKTGPGEPQPMPAILPQPCLTLEDGWFRIRRGDPFQKMFFAYQPISLRVGSAGLQLERPADSGEEPESGHPTMAFAGHEWDMVEIEQASTWRPGDGTTQEAFVILRTTSR